MLLQCWLNNEKNIKIVAYPSMSFVIVILINFSMISHRSCPEKTWVERHIFFVCHSRRANLSWKVFRSVSDGFCCTWNRTVIILLCERRNLIWSAVYRSTQIRLLRLFLKLKPNFTIVAATFLLTRASFNFLLPSQHRQGFHHPPSSKKLP